MHLNILEVLCPGHRALCTPSAIPTEPCWGFPHGELWSESLGSWKTLLPAQLGSSINHLPFQADLPYKGTPIRSRTELKNTKTKKESQAQKQEEITTALRNKKDCELKGFVGTMSVFFVLLECCQKFASVSLTATIQPSNFFF